MSVKRGGLGRNLSALLSSSAVTGLHSQPAVQSLALDSLQPGKYQPRKFMDEDLLKELAGSIRQQGLLQPLVVRMLDNGCYEIIAGERRWRACRLAELQEVPVIIRQVDDETAMAMALVENLQREDLNPLDQARAMARLVEEFTLTHQQIADLLSKSRAAVSNHLRLLTLSSEVMPLLEAGRLDMGHARTLLMLEPSQQLQVANLVVAGDLSVRETEKLVARIREGRAQQTTVAEIFPGSMQDQVALLAQHLKSKVKVKPGRDGKGSLIIHYNSLQDLETVIQQIVPA